MKSALAIAVVLFFCSAPGFSQKSSEPKGLKIGFVDTDVMLRQLPEAADADKRLREMGVKFQDTLKVMQQQFTERLEKYQKQGQMMTAESKGQEENALKALQQNLLLYQEEKLGNTGELSKLRDQLLAPLREKIQKGITDVAKSEGFSFVFDKANPSMLYAEDKYDITFTVLDRIKRGK